MGRSIAKGAVRQGEVLLAGLLRCGHCGRKSQANNAFVGPGLTEIRREGEMNRAVRVMILSIFGMAWSSGLAVADPTPWRQSEIDCQQWQANIKPGQSLTEELRRQARVITPNGVITTEHISGRRNIWMDKNNLIKRATCG
jgi:hypothetical protein